MFEIQDLERIQNEIGNGVKVAICLYGGTTTLEYLFEAENGTSYTYSHRINESDLTGFKVEYVDFLIAVGKSVVKRNANETQ